VNSFFYTWFVLNEKDGKVQILASEKMDRIFQGSSSEEDTINSRKKNYFLHQKKGPLLPIKRYSQFENRMDKSRIHPMDNLIQNMCRKKNSQLQIKFRPVPEKKRIKALSKSKKAWFRADRFLDQWESKTWFKKGIRNYFGPVLRKILTRISVHQKEVNEKMLQNHDREDVQSAILDKLSRPLFEVEISMSHPFKSFFNGFSIPYLGKLAVLNKFGTMILSSEELASILATPNPENCRANLFF